MGQVFQILLKIGGDASEALAVINRVTSALNNFGSRIAGMTSGVASAGSALMNGLTAPARTAASVLDTVFRTIQQSTSSLISGLTNAGRSVFFITQLAQGMGALATAIVAPNAQLERLRVAFTGILRDGGAAQQLLNQIRALADTTPFEFPQLALAAQKLLGVKVAAQDIVPLMTAIGDAVAGVGGGAFEIDRVTRAITQMASKGRVQTEELLQIAETGIPAFQILAEQLGMTGEQLAEALKKGTVSAAEALPALARGFQETFGGAMAAQAQTFSGLLSTLSDRFTSLRTAFGAPIFDVFKQAIVDFMGLLGSNQVDQTAANFGTAVAAGLQLGINAVKALYDTFVTTFGSVSSVLSSVALNVASFVGVFAAALAPLRGLLTAVLQGDFAQAGALVGEALSNIASIAVAAIADLAAGLFTGGVNVAASFADGLISGATSYVMAAINYITSLIASFLQGFSPPKRGPLSTIDRWFAPVLNAYLKGGLSGADWSILTDISDRVASGLEDMVEAGRATADDVRRVVLGNDPSSGITALVAQALAEIRANGQVTAESLGRIQAALGEQFSDIFREIQAQLSAATLTREIERLQEELAGLNDPGAQQALRDAIETAQEAYKNARDPRAARAAKEQLGLLKQRSRDEDRRKQQLQEQIALLQKQQRAVQDQISGFRAIERIQERQIRLLESLNKTIEAGGGGGGGAAAIDRAAKAQRDYNYHIQDTQGKLAILRGELANVEEGSEEYYRILGQIYDLEQDLAGEAERSAKAAEEKARRAAEAQWAYNYAIADGPGKLELLRQKLATVEEGSEEWYRIQTQIAELTGQQNEEQAQLAEKAAKDAQARADAEWEYNYSVADTAGKLAMLREKLGTVQEGSEEYWRIRQQIAQVEDQAAREAEKAAKAHEKTGKAAKGSGEAIKAAGAGGVLSFENLRGVAENAGGTVDKIKELSERAGEKWQEVTQKFEDGKQKLAELRQRATEFIHPFQTAIGTVGSYFQTITNGIAIFRAQLGAGLSIIDAFRGTLMVLGIDNPFEPLINGVMQLLGVFGGGAAAAGIFALLSPIQQIGPTFQKVLPYISSFRTAIAGIGAAFGEGGVLSGIMAIIGVLGGPLTVAFALAAAAVGAFVYAYINNLGGARDFLNPILENLAGVFGAFATQVATIASNLGNFFGPAIDAVISALSALAPIGAVIVAVILSIVGGILGFVTGALPGALTFIAGVVQAVAGVIQVAAGIITGIVGVVVGVVTGLLTGDWSDAWNAAKSLVMNVVEGIGNVFGGLGRTLLGLVATIVGGIVGFFQGLYDTLVGNSIVPDMVDAILDYFTDLYEDGTAFISDLVSVVIGFFSTLFTDGVERVRNLKNDALELFNTLKDLGIQAIQALLTGNLSELGRLMTEGVAAVLSFKDKALANFDGFKETATTTVKTLAGNVVTAVTNLATDVGNLAQTFVTKALAIGTGIMDGIKQGVSNGVGALIDAVKRAAQQALDAAKDLLGISSPSTAFDREVGFETMTGAARGVRRGSGLLMQTMKQVAERMVEPFSSVNTAINGALASSLGNVPVALNQTPLRLQAEQLRGMTLASIAGASNQLDYHPTFAPVIQVADQQALLAVVEQMFLQQEQRVLQKLRDMMGVE